MWARSYEHNLPTEVRGVQMVFLIKGRKVPISEDANPTDTATNDYKQKRLDSPLIWGYQDNSFPPKLAASRYYNCTHTHPMRKSKWYPSGQCEQPGKLHKRGDEWKSFPVWTASGGVEEWIHSLHNHNTCAEDGDVLDRSWTMPIPFFRTSQQIISWRRQAMAQEERIADTLQVASDNSDSPPTDRLPLQLLDAVFPQYTHNCNSFYGGQCPCYDLCWGPAQIAQDPLGSGIYQPHEQYTDLALPEMEG